MVMSNAQIIEKCTVRDYMGTRPDYVEIKAVRFYSAELADQLEAEREALRATDPFEGVDWT